jgi:hypothetical protein
LLYFTVMHMCVTGIDFPSASIIFPLYLGTDHMTWYFVFISGKHDVQLFKSNVFVDNHHITRPGIKALYTMYIYSSTSIYHIHPLQHYVIKFVSDMRRSVVFFSFLHHIFIIDIWMLSKHIETIFWIGVYAILHICEKKFKWWWLTILTIWAKRTTTSHFIQLKTNGTRY